MDTINPSDQRLTVHSIPPPKAYVERRGKPYWPHVLSEARECPGDWLRTSKWFTKGTAIQVASDLRNAHLDRSGRVRVRGLLPGDRWETRSGLDPSDPDPTHFYVWLRYDGVHPSVAEKLRRQTPLW